jgi:autotransporter-associated beta strand protein
MLKNPLDVNGAEILNSNSAISIYFGKISAATATTPTLFKRGKGEIRGDKALLTDPDANDGWDQTKLVVEEGLFRVGHFAEETIFGKVPASYIADAIKLDGRGVARVDGAAAIGVTSGLGEHNAVTTTPATRGIFVEANGGTICTSLGGNRWDIESIISGPGGLNINGNGFPITGAGIYDTASSILRFKGANTYAGGTIVNSGFLEVDGATATLGNGNVTVDGVTVGINGAAAVAAGRLRILSGVSNAIANTAGVSLTGGGTAGVADVGYIDLAAGINEIVNTLSLNGVGQPAGTYGATGSGAANIMDEYFLGGGILTVTTTSGAGAGIVPEPAAWVLFMVGAAAIGSRRRRR